MYARIVTIIYFIVSFSLLPAQSQAIFLAIDDYSATPEYSSLRNPVKDAKAVANEIGRNYGFSNSVHENISKAFFTKKIQDLTQRSYNPNEQLFIFISGHGEYDPFSKVGYFVFGNGQKIRFTVIKEWLQVIDCDHLLAIFDACYSGTLEESYPFRKSKSFNRPRESPLAALERLVNSYFSAPGKQYITSGGKERTSDGINHSPLTERILFSLKQARASGDNLLTYDNLRGQLSRLLPRPNFGKMSGHGGGEFVFIANSIRNKITIAGEWKKVNSSYLPKDFIEGKVNPKAVKVTGKITCFDCEQDDTEYFTAIVDRLGRYRVETSSILFGNKIKYYDGATRVPTVDWDILNVEKLLYYSFLGYAPFLKKNNPSHDLLGGFRGIITSKSGIYQKFYDKSFDCYDVAIDGYIPMSIYLNKGRVDFAVVKNLPRNLYGQMEFVEWKQTKEGYLLPQKIVLSEDIIYTIESYQELKSVDPALFKSSN